MYADPRRVLATGRPRHLTLVLIGSLTLGLLAGATSVGLLALSGWFIAMSALAGAGLASGFSFFYPSAGVQALAFGRTTIRYLERLSGHSATLRIDAGLKEAVFVSAVGPRPGGRESAEQHTGALLHAIESDAEIAESALLRVVAPVVTYTGVLIGGCVLVALTVSPMAAAIIASGGSVVALMAVLPGWLSSLRPGRLLAEGESQARQELVDALDGLDELVSFGAEALAFQRVEHAFTQVERAQDRLRHIEVASRALASGIVGATVLLVAGYTSGTIGNDRAAVPSAVAVTLAALGMLQLSDPLAGAAREMARTRTVWPRLAAILPETPQTPRPTVGIPGSVAVRDLSIDRGRGVIVDELSFSASPGQTILLNGPSGAGKTTVVLALAGQLGLTSAGVRLGGKVMSLPQHPYAFRGTIVDNLRIASPEATEEQMEEVAQIVGLHLAGAGSGLGERIGAGGRQLSGGQLRRLAIAQVLLAKPDILLADEPTEGLDADSARWLLLTLRRSDPHMTMVLALHEQQAGQLSWTPNTVIRLRLDRPVAEVSSDEAEESPMRPHRPSC